MKKNVKLVFSFAILSSLLMLHQNCGGPQNDEGFTIASNLDNTPTVQYDCGDIEGLFRVTYRPFLQQKCAACHYGGGPGNGTFADSNFTTAFNSFQNKGYTLISSYATNGAHNGAITGSINGGNDNKVDSLQEIWITGLAEAENCADASGSNGTGPIVTEDRINTLNKNIGLLNVGETKVLEWNLSSELVSDKLPVPTLPDAKLRITIQVVDVLGQTAYYINEPRISNSAVDISMESLRVIINNEYVAGETTFNFIQKNIYKRTDTLLSAGTMVALGINRNSDTLALSFGAIESVILPPPDDLPVVEFSISELRPSIEGGSYSVDVKLNKAITEAVVANVFLDQSASAKVRRSLRDGDTPYDYFDWDATLGTVSSPSNTESVTFIPGGPTAKTLTLLVSDDDRQENAETARLKILSAEGAIIGAKDTFSLVIPSDPKDVNQSGPFAPPTFTSLMETGSVLQTNCLVCHNTVEKQGGYDMTDYYSMASFEKGIIVPGTNWINSKMIERLRLNGPGRMPLDQALDADDQRLIEKWIQNGAKNN